MPTRLHIRHVLSHNVAAFKGNPWSEISGSLGDLGTFLPIFLALSSAHSIAPAATLVFSGGANIASGLLFGLPIPIQPMKAIAAACLESHCGVQTTVAAGLLVSGTVLLLSLTGLLGWLGRVVPVPVVRGIQLGAGLQLMGSAGARLLAQLGWTSPKWSDNLIWTLATFGFLLFCVVLETRKNTRIPFALMVTLAGIILAIAGPSGGDHFPGPSIWHPKIYEIHLSHFKEAISTAVGQLPLTVLNSILATSSLAGQLFPNEPTPSLPAIGISLAITNFISAPFGAMPICHGSGGLAGQYRFGARSGASVVFLGVIKLILGVFATKPVLYVIQRFPLSMLGIMVIAAGIELAKVAESLNRDGEDGHYGDEEASKRFTVMLVTVAGIIAFRNDAVGFIAGILWHLGLHSHDILGGSSTWGLSRLHWRSRVSESEPLLN
jgi:MFS superfamily sulfate permease-like transporter